MSLALADRHYPDAHHAFDGARPKKNTYVAAVRGGKGATVEYNLGAHEDSEKQVKPLLETQLGP